jgi:hypothetical protein
MLLPEQIQVRLGDLAEALRDARDNPLPAPTPPEPPLDENTMRALAKQDKDLAELVTARTAALEQRTAAHAKAQEQLRQVYGDALARIAAVLPKGDGTPREPRPRPGPVIKR